MNITDIKIRRLNHGRLKAAATVTFDNQLVVHDIKLIEGLEKNFLAMPSKLLADGTHMDIVHPISKELRQALEDAVFEHYQATIEEFGEPPATNSQNSATDPHEESPIPNTPVPPQEVPTSPVPQEEVPIPQAPVPQDDTPAEDVSQPHNLQTLE